MVEVISPEYEGPERRKAIIVTDHCPCHLKHDAVLRTHTDTIKVLVDDMKSKVNWKLFILATGIIIGTSTFLWTEVRTNTRTLHDVDKRLEGESVRGRLFESQSQQSFEDIQEAIENLHQAIDDHRDEWRKINGNIQPFRDKEEERKRKGE